MSSPPTGQHVCRDCGNRGPIINAEGCLAYEFGQHFVWTEDSGVMCASYDCRSGTNIYVEEPLPAEEPTFLGGYRLHDAQVRELNKLLRDVAAALAIYVRHADGCRMGHAFPDVGSTCTCGLAELLT